jgi:hypothetical protein
MTMTPRDIIALWPSPAQFADDIGLSNKDYVRLMRFRNRIPRVWWPDVAQAARRRKLPVTKELLHEVHGVEMRRRA